MVEVEFMSLQGVYGTAAVPGLWHTLAMQRDDPKNKAKVVNFKNESRVNDTSPADDTRPKEVGGRGGLDPTRYGDWEKGGRCIDF